MTPLYYASRFGHFRVAQALLHAGANVHAQDYDGVQPIHGASVFERGDNTAVIGLLLKHGADIRARPRDAGTPLQFAITRGSTNIIRFLLQNDADPNSRRRNTTGIPAIHQSIYTTRHHAIVEILLEHGADINVLDDGESVLHALAVHGNVEMMRALIKMGRRFEKGVVTTSLKGKKGKTPFLPTPTLHARREPHR
jgi:ankyrin